MKYVESNIQLIYELKKYDVVLIPMDINNSFSKGLRYEVNLNFKGLKEKEIESGYGNRNKYGKIYPIKSGGIIFCMCYMYRTRFKHTDSSDTVDYDALKSCLLKVRDTYQKEKVIGPLIGAEQWDGNGNKDKIKKIYEEVFSNCDNVTLCDYKQRDYVLEMFHKIAELHEKLVNREISPDEYITERSKVEWKRVNGVLKPMPEGYAYIPRSDNRRKK